MLLTAEPSFQPHSDPQSQNKLNISKANQNPGKIKLLKLFKYLFVALSFISVLPHWLQCCTVSCGRWGRLDHAIDFFFKINVLSYYCSLCLHGNNMCNQYKEWESTDKVNCQPGFPGSQTQLQREDLVGWNFSCQKCPISTCTVDHGPWSKEEKIISACFTN